MCRLHCALWLVFSFHFFNFICIWLIEIYIPKWKAQKKKSVMMMVVLTWYDHSKQNIKLNWVRAWVFSLYFFVLSPLALHHNQLNYSSILPRLHVCASVYVWKRIRGSLVSAWARMCAFIYTIYFISHTLYTQFYGYQFIFKINITSHAVHLPSLFVFVFTSSLLSLLFYRIF